MSGSDIAATVDAIVGEIKEYNRSRLGRSKQRERARQVRTFREGIKDQIAFLSGKRMELAQCRIKAMLDDRSNPSLLGLVLKTIEKELGKIDQEIADLECELL